MPHRKSKRQREFVVVREVEHPGCKFTEFMWCPYWPARVEETARDKGLTLTQVAERSNPPVALSRLSEVRNNARQITWAFHCRVMDALGVPHYAWIRDREEEPTDGSLDGEDSEDG